MLPKIKPHHTDAWDKLERHHKKISETHLRELFADDPDRFANFSISFEDILFDYSKNRITGKTLSLLIDLANECRVPEAIEAMFSGEAINETEGRSVLHTALRNTGNEPVFSQGKDVMPEVHRVLQQMK